MPDLDVTVIIGTFGSEHWAELAGERAIPSVEAEGVPYIHNHGSELATYGESLAASRNEAVRQVDSEWLCFLDADDELERGFFKAMEQAGAGDLLTPAVRYIRPGRRVPPEPMFWPVTDIRDSNYLIVSTLIRREMFWQHGGFEPFDMYEDWAIFSRCIRDGATVVQVPKAVCRVHVNPSSKHRRGSTRAEKLAAHHAVRSAVWPELYADAA